MPEHICEEGGEKLSPIRRKNDVQVFFKKIIQNNYEKCAKLRTEMRDFVSYIIKMSPASKIYTPFNEFRA